jgi:hypothetical protein
MNLELLPKVELSSIEPTKFSIELLKQNIVHHFRETGDNPLEMLVKAEALIQLLDGIRAELKEDVIEILDRHPNGKAEVLGAEVSRFESAVKYAYDGDYTWQKLNQEVESIKHKQKERESLLKTIKDPLVDPETGEMIHPVPRISTTTFKISLKK